MFFKHRINFNDKNKYLYLIKIPEEKKTLFLAPTQ